MKAFKDLQQTRLPPDCDPKYNELDAYEGLKAISFIGFCCTITAYFVMFAPVTNL